MKESLCGNGSGKDYSLQQCGIHLARLDYFWESLQTMVVLPFSDQLSKHGNIIVVLLMLMTNEKLKQI